MARYTGPRCRVCRRVGMKLFLKTKRCYEKCTLDKRPFVPGQHGQDQAQQPAQIRVSVYKQQLLEQQKLRYMYGVLKKQLKNYFKIAKKKKGLTGENLLCILERRLDNVLYRLNFAVTRAQARQMTTHGHVLVNNKKVDIPSYLVKKGDIITVKEKISKLVKNNVEEAKGVIPQWLALDKEKLEGKVLDYPKREDIDFIINENLIVEFYTR